MKLKKIKNFIVIYFFISVILFYLDHKFCKDDKLILTKKKKKVTLVYSLKWI